MLKTEILYKFSGLSDSSLCAMITPKAKISICRIEFDQDLIKDPSRMDEFIKCWVHTFSPYYSKSNNPVIVSSLILHYILFNGLQSSAFVKYLVNSKSTIFHPVYQKAVFDELAVAVRTDFMSRVEGSTNTAYDLEAVYNYLTSIADGELKDHYLKLCSFNSFGFVVEERDVQLSFKYFKALVGSMSRETGDDVLNSLLKLNNQVISNLDRVVSRQTSLDVLAESYNNYYKAQLGIYKFRNISTDTYAIQDRGWDSYSPTSANLAFIILNLFRPSILSIDATGRLPVSTVGGKSLIPNDVLLDLGLLTSEECLLSLFSMRVPSSGDSSYNGSRNKTKGNYLSSNSSGPVIGNAGPSDNLAHNHGTKREYSTTHACKAYFGRYLCYKHIKLIYHN